MVTPIAPLARTAGALASLDGLERLRVFGRVAAVRGLLIEIAGPVAAMEVGARLMILVDGGAVIPCEVIGFSGERALAMPFGSLQGVRRGCEARIAPSAAAVRPSPAWISSAANRTSWAVQRSRTPRR